MIDLLTGVFVLICAVEAFLIYREASRFKEDSKLTKALQNAQAEIQSVKSKLRISEESLDSARKEVQGIYVLWNKSIEAEQKMRRELDIAKTQLTYLAQKVVRLKDSSPVETASNASSTATAPAYWETSHNSTPYRESVKGAAEIQHDFL